LLETCVLAPHLTPTRPIKTEMNYDYLWSGLAAAAAFIVYSLWTAKDVKRAPGPAGLPFIGNALSIPSKSPGPYFYFEQLAKKYGQLMLLNVS
jgi:hypothetical protein